MLFCSFSSSRLFSCSLSSLSQPGPFKDPTSPMQIPSNWGGLPRPTFSPGPRSTVSRTSTGHPAPIPSTQANEIRSNDAVGGWKPNAPSFIPSAQATQATSASPAVLAASSAPLASNFGWNTTGATTSSVAMPESTGIVFTSNGPSPQSVSNNAPERVPAPAVSVTGTTPAANGQTATNPSPVSGWTDMKTASNDGHGPIQAVSSSNERSQASIQQTEPQMTSNPAAFGWNVKQPTSNTGIAPQFQGQVPQREETPRPAAQQPSSFQNVCYFSLLGMNE